MGAPPHSHTSEPRWPVDTPCGSPQKGLEAVPASLTLETIVVAAPGQLSSTLGNEEVILNPETGVYYGLADVGARIWALLKEPCTIASICEVILAEYEVDRERCQQDVLALVSQLAEAQLIEVRDAPDEGTTASDDQ